MEDFLTEVTINNVTSKDLKGIFFLLRDSQNSEIRIGSSKNRGFGEIEFEIEELRIENHRNKKEIVPNMDKYFTIDEARSIKLGDKYLRKVMLLKDQEGFIGELFGEVRQMESRSIDRILDLKKEIEGDYKLIYMNYDIPNGIKTVENISDLNDYERENFHKIVIFNDDFMYTLFKAHKIFLEKIEKDDFENFEERKLYMKDNSRLKVRIGKLKNCDRDGFQYVDFEGVRQLAKKGKLIELTVKGRKIKLDSENEEFQVRKTEWRNNQFKEFSIGDEIEYEIDSDGNFKFIGIKRNKIVKVSKELKEKSKPKKNKIVKVSKELKGKSKPKKNKDAFDYPYNFVSLGNKNNIDRQNMASDEYRKKMKFSGKLECTLENFTPLFTAGKKNPLPLKDKNGKVMKDKKGRIRNHEQEDFLKDRDNYIVPSSTLKTTVRTVMEVLTNSCMRNVGKDKKTKNKFSPYDKIPKEYRPCNDPKRLCFACRLFGSTGNDKEGKKGFESFAGRVQFTDAIIPIKEAKIENNYQILVPLGGPHEEFANRIKVL